MSAGFLIIGVLLISLSIWQWRGRSWAARWWTRHYRMEGPVLVGMPALGPVLAGVGLADFPGAVFVGALLSVLGVVVCVWGLLTGLVAPLWRPAARAWGPRWYVHRDVKGCGLSRPAVPSGLGLVRGGWRGGCVVDVDARVCPDRLGRRGTVVGRLVVGEGGVWFAPDPDVSAYSMFRGSVWVEWRRVREVRTVPARAGADGRPRGSWFRCSWGRRVVVVADEDTYLFEVDWGRASKAAASLEAIWQAERSAV